MEQYSKAFNGMYPQSEQKEADPMEKYIGRSARFLGEKVEVVGYRRDGLSCEPLLIVDASKGGGWTALEPFDFVFKDCEYYRYAGIGDLVD